MTITKKKRKPAPRSKKPTKKIKRHNKSPRLGLFLLAGVLTIAIIWGILREPIPVPKDLERVVEQAIQKPAKRKSITRAEKKEEKRKKKAEKDRDVAQLVPLDETSTPQSTPQKLVKPASPPKKGETNIDQVVRGAVKKLGVPDSAVKRKKKDELITFTIPIDRSEMDLTYANMVLKGTMESAGISFLKGTDSKSKQSLLFHVKGHPERYQVDLSYDSKIYADKENPKTITIVIDDFGAIGGTLLEGYLALDKEVVFAIFPDEPNSEYTMKRCTMQGRESIIHVPMEPIGYPGVNPGKNAILVQHTPAHTEKLLSHFITKMPDCIGINNHMGSLATTDGDVMQTVMGVLKKHNKLFLDSRTSNVSVAYQTAQKAHLRAFRNDMFLDSPNVSQSTMDDKLNQILLLSASRSNIIAITHCHNKEKLDYLKSLILRLKKAGFKLIPLSEVGEHKVPEIL